MGATNAGHRTCLPLNQSDQTKICFAKIRPMVCVRVWFAYTQHSRVTTHIEFPGTSPFAEATDSPVNVSIIDIKLKCLWRTFKVSLAGCVHRDCCWPHSIYWRHTGICSSGPKEITLMHLCDTRCDSRACERCLMPMSHSQLTCAIQLAPPSPRTLWRQPFGFIQIPKWLMSEWINWNDDDQQTRNWNPTKRWQNVWFISNALVAQRAMSTAPPTNNEIQRKIFI